MTQRICRGCDVIFRPRVKHQLYHSRECRKAATYQPAVCVWCGGPLGDRNITCSDACSTARKEQAVIDHRRCADGLARLKARHALEDAFTARSADGATYKAIQRSECLRGSGDAGVHHSKVEG